MQNNFGLTLDMFRELYLRQSYDVYQHCLTTNPERSHALKQTTDVFERARKKMKTVPRIQLTTQRQDYILQEVLEEVFGEGGANIATISQEIDQPDYMQGMESAVANIEHMTQQNQTAEDLMPADREIGELPHFMPSAAVSVVAEPEDAPDLMPVAAESEAVPDLMPMADEPEATPDLMPVAAEPEATPDLMPVAAEPEAAPDLMPTAAEPEATPDLMPTAAEPKDAPDLMPMAAEPEDAPNLGGVALAQEIPEEMDAELRASILSAMPFMEEDDSIVHSGNGDRAESAPVATNDYEDTYTDNPPIERPSGETFPWERGEKSIVGFGQDDTATPQAVEGMKVGGGKSPGMIFAIVMLFVAIFVLGWILIGILGPMISGPEASVDLGYSWFNENVFPLF